MNPRPKVVITYPIHNRVKQMLDAECEVVANQGLDGWLPEKLVEVAREAQALMAFMPDRVDSAFLSACPRLRVIAAALKGYDNIDVAACTQRGIWVTAVADLLSPPTAELALALILPMNKTMAMTKVLPAESQTLVPDDAACFPSVYVGAAPRQRRYSHRKTAWR